MDNKKYLKKIVEKIFENVLTMKNVFGIITKSLVAESDNDTSENEVRTLTNKQ